MIILALLLSEHRERSDDQLHSANRAYITFFFKVPYRKLDVVSLALNFEFDNVTSYLIEQ